MKKNKRQSPHQFIAYSSKTRQFELNTTE
jgi:hypothetical protein